MTNVCKTYFRLFACCTTFPEFNFTRLLETRKLIVQTGSYFCNPPFSLEPPAAGRKKSCLFADKLKIFQKYFGNFQTDRGKFSTDAPETPSFCPERTSRRFPCPTPGSGRNQTKQAQKPEKNKMFRVRSRGRPEKLSVSGRSAAKAVCALRRICAGTCSSD